ALVMDGHVDTPSLMLDEGYRLGERHAPQPGRAHLDLPRMVEGGLDAPFFSIFVSRHYGEGQGATDRALAMIAEVERQVEALDGVAMAYTSGDVLRLTRGGQKAILLGLEGGHALQASEAVLAQLRDAGIRYVTLTHTNTNAWADSSQDTPRHGGLTEQGVALVQAMNRLGVLVDVSHVSDGTFADAVRASRAPVLASHSSARALTPNVRNLSDAQLRALAATGGVALVNLYADVVNRALDTVVMAAVERRVERDYGGDLTRLWDAIGAESAARGLRAATLADALDHIEHIAAVAGVDHVGLGSDFDGVPALPEGLEDVTRLPWITHGLLARGWAEEDVRKVLGGNLLRALAEAERVAREMQ
ncbi:MAG: dipeptidase, partial [Rubricoccaceae bacterium]|nr:dipeptidase [Rubricoccaceae bacterium]